MCVYINLMSELPPPPLPASTLETSCYDSREIAALRDLFQPILDRPTFIDQHINEASETAVERMELYISALHAGYQASLTEGGSEDLTTNHKARKYLLNSLCSSCGTEVRLIVMGLKPAFVDNLGDSRPSMVGMEKYSALGPLGYLQGRHRNHKRWARTETRRSIRCLLA